MKNFDEIVIVQLKLSENILKLCINKAFLIYKKFRFSLVVAKIIEGTCICFRSKTDKIALKKNKYNLKQKDSCILA